MGHHELRSSAIRQGTLNRPAEFGWPAHWGTSENAVKTQIWSWACSGYAGCTLARRRQVRDEAIAVSVLCARVVAIVKKRLRLDASLYTQVLSVTIFEKMPIQTALSSETSKCDTAIENNQLNLLGFNRTLVSPASNSPIIARTRGSAKRSLP